MKSQFNKALLGSLALASILSVAPSSVNASTLINGWSYAADSTIDGSDTSGFSSSSRFNFYGAGLKQVGSEIWFAVNSNLDLNGVNLSGKQVGYGDLLFDFSPSTSYQANHFEYGIRFAPNDNNPNSSNNGLYSNVTAQAVALSNQGYSSLSHYASTAKNWTGNDAKIGDLAVNDPYYRDINSTVNNPTFNSGIPNLINHGNFVSAIEFLSSSDLDAQGFNKNSMGFNGTSTYGFKFTKPQGFQGDFVASLFFECINDSIAIKGNVKPVPVPGLALGVVFAGACGFGQVLRNKRKQKAVA
ncbi:hypothetical protein TUMEXPCC7403_06465 [Tumidithrix helvetica PCC 7403]|uniref:XDD3 family exosortase-dependent surface protein n=1 Tax=Tumidithrix helvetica TaxID=3457545 RepID=UPI003C8459B2